MGKKPTSALPPKWCFPTADPQIFTCCELNPKDGEYNKNCKTVRKKDMNKSFSRQLQAHVNAANKYL